MQTTYDALRGLGIVGSSPVGEDEDSDLNNPEGRGRNTLSRHSEVKFSSVLEQTQTYLIIIIRRKRMIEFYVTAVTLLNTPVFPATY